MNNLVTVYESFNDARRQEKCRANNLLSCIKEGIYLKDIKLLMRNLNNKKMLKK